MSDWSYRYNQPRAEVHEARYGTTEVPERRGAGGVKATAIGGGATTALIALGVGLALIGLALRR